MSLVVSRSDLFPVGTTVGAYPETGEHADSAPNGAAVESHAVASNGKLTFTTLVEGTRYVLYAEVAGERRYLKVQGPVPAAEYLTLQQRLAVRRSQVGAGLPVVRLESPVSPSSTKAPTFTGFASDSGTVTVKVYEGASASGSVASTATATPSGGLFTTGAASPALTAGTWTAVAEQTSTLDPSSPAGMAEPVTTVSDPVTFVVT